MGKFQKRKLNLNFTRLQFCGCYTRIKRQFKIITDICESILVLRANGGGGGSKTPAAFLGFYYVKMCSQQLYPAVSQHAVGLHHNFYYINY